MVGSKRRIAMRGDDNIEPVARAIAERIWQRSGGPESGRQAWIDRHWECAAAELEAGVIDETGAATGANWERGLAAYRERLRSKPRSVS